MLDTPDTRVPVAFLVPPDTFARVFTAADVVALRSHPRIKLLSDRPIDPFRDVAALAEVEVLLTGWGSPQLEAGLLDRMPRLRAVAHSAGSVRPVVGDEVWARGIAVTSSAGANAVPVAEFTVAMLVLAAKRALPAAGLLRDRRGPVDLEGLWPQVGFHGLTIGVIGASRVGRAVITRLRGFDVDVVVADPYLDPLEAGRLGVRRVELLELARSSDIVSLHAPLLPETVGMVDREFIGALRSGTTFVNTARGGLVDQDALADRLEAGDLHAVLDVTEPELLPVGHRLWSMPNTLITPHLAGSVGNELRRLARNVVRETQNFATTGHFDDTLLVEALSLQA